MTILLARTLAPSDYGTFAVAYEAFLFLTILYRAFVLEPLAVFGSSTYRTSLKSYMSTLLRIHFMVGGVVVLLVGMSAWICSALGVGQGITQALLAASVAAPCVLLFWLVRRAFYVELAPRGAVSGAAVYFGVVVGGLLLVYRFGTLTPEKAFLLMAVGGLSTAVTMLWRLRLHLSSREKDPGVGKVVRTHWEYGRWAAASGLAIWLAGALYYPLLGSVRGLANAGQLKALMNLTSPVSQIFAGVSLLSLPYASRVYHRQGEAGGRRLIWKLAALYAGGTMLYWAIIMIWRGSVLNLLYDGRYTDIANLIPWIALGSILRISATAHAIILRAMQSPWLVFFAYAGSCLVALLVGVPLAWAFGLRGAVISLALSSGVALVIGLTVLHRQPALRLRVQAGGTTLR